MYFPIISTLIKSIAKSFLLAIVYFVIAANSAAAQKLSYARGEILVKMKSAAYTEELSFEKNLSQIKIIRDLTDSYKIRQATPLLPLKSGNKKRGPGNFIKLQFAPETDPAELITLLERDPQIEYAQRNHVYEIHSTPNDSLFEKQLALQIVNAEMAWTLQLASPDVIVAIIDTGIDYVHEDLVDAIWINSGEDLNNNGSIDNGDFNGIDDDGNGFIDDIRGWDFTDALTFADGGDFLEPDNDPRDENGHGTSVAGIIGATGNNRKGIAGLAYGCRLMNLRAGTSLGFLEEDDVASAIVYAVENGARIINMSFGDVVASPLLRDVIQYAYNQNCILVASAGNAATDQIHFPSGFEQTLSVGASTQSDALATFSNYGTTLDVVAPGVNILTTNLNNTYGTFSGTSASAPFVSALSALLLSKDPDLTNTAIIADILDTADDLGNPGWDNFFGAGRINAFRALLSPHNSIAQLTAPSSNQGFSSGSVPVRGTAVGPFMQQTILEIGVGATPETWNELLRQIAPVVEAPITDIPLNQLNDTTYTLKLIVEDKDGRRIEDKVSFFVDSTPPLISNLKQTTMLDGDRPSVLIEFQTDDLCNAALNYKSAGSATFQSVDLRYQTKTHRFNFSQELVSGLVEYFIETTNVAGLTAIDDNAGRLYELDLRGAAIGGIPVEELALTLPSAFLLNQTTDFDGDGSKEIIINQYDQSFNFGPLKILEFDSQSFEEVFSTSEILIPRDTGDSDGDGLPEIFAGAGSRSFIFEAKNPNSFPDQIVWQDENAWASRFSDLDRDGLGELIMRVNDVFEVREMTGDNVFTTRQTFPNPTSGSNGVGVPKSIVGDFDGDMQTEILFGDGDGDIYIYENRVNDQYEFTWSERMPLLDTIDYLTAADYDGDGIDEFVVGSHTDPNLNTESTFDSRHWLYRIYKRIGDNSFAPIWQQAYFGFQSPADFDSGVSSGDIDNDGRPEIFISVFPDLYLVDFDVARSDYRIIWHTAAARSNSVIVSDFTEDGRNEFFFNDGFDVRGYRLISDFVGPLTPTGFRGSPLDTSRVQLEWHYETQNDGFRIYRGLNQNTLFPYSLIPQQSFIDTAVVEGTQYWYAVTAVDSSLSPTESLPTPRIKITPGARPFLFRAETISNDQIVAEFSEKMSRSVKNQTNFKFDQEIVPTSSVSHRSGAEVILTSPIKLTPGVHQLSTSNVFDIDRTPIDTTRNSTRFSVPETASIPFLVRASLISSDRLQLVFSEPMDAASVSQVQNYLIEPDIQIQSVQPDAVAATIVFLTIVPDAPIGPFGLDYIITARNVKSITGRQIQKGIGDTIALTFSNSDLSNVFAYPNPYRGDSVQDYVTIAGLTAEATVRIHDSNGRVIRTLQESDGNGGIRWDLKDESGRNVASGIYIFYVVGGGGKAMGKLAVVR